MADDLDNLSFGQLERLRAKQVQDGERYKAMLLEDIRETEVDLARIDAAIARQARRVQRVALDQLSERELGGKLLSLCDRLGNSRHERHQRAADRLRRIVGTKDVDRLRTAVGLAQQAVDDLERRRADSRLR